MAEIISQQSRLFLISILYGGLLGIWYDVFRVIRKRFVHTGKMVHMEDIIFAFTAAAGLFFLFQIYNRGSIRFYAVLGVASGAGIYYGVISWFARRILDLLLKIVMLIWKSVDRIILKPPKLIVKSVVKSLKKAIRTVKIINSRK